MNVQGPADGAKPVVTLADAFFGAEALIDSIESGAIAPLSGRWLVSLAAEGGVLKRRQELPPSAFITASQARKLVSALGEDFGLAFVALSYRWLAAGAPDADGWHLKRVAAAGRDYLAAPHHTSHRSPLMAAFGARGVDATAADFAVFWDFVRSLVQAPPISLSALLMAGWGARRARYFSIHARPRRRRSFDEACSSRMCGTDTSKLSSGRRHSCHRR